jgi:hypothetical protein
MTIKDLQAILAEAEKLYAAIGDRQSAASLREFNSGLSPFYSKKVDAFVKMVAENGRPS